MKKIVIGLIVVVVLGGSGYFYYKSRYQLAPDQIFQEASSQLGFKRDNVAYFNIFGQDRISYSLGQGVSFAYKTNGQWQISGKGPYQSIPLCSELQSVPEKYRQACEDGGKGLKYSVRKANGGGSNENYPDVERVKYIGE